MTLADMMRRRKLGLDQSIDEEPSEDMSDDLQEGGDTPPSDYTNEDPSIQSYLEQSGSTPPVDLQTYNRKRPALDAYMNLISHPPSDVAPTKGRRLLGALATALSAAGGDDMGRAIKTGMGIISLPHDEAEKDYNIRAKQLHDLVSVENSGSNIDSLALSRLLHHGIEQQNADTLGGYRNIEGQGVLARSAAATRNADTNAAKEKAYEGELGSKDTTRKAMVGIHQADYQRRVAQGDRANDIRASRVSPTKQSKPPSMSQVSKATEMAVGELRKSDANFNQFFDKDGHLLEANDPKLNDPKVRKQYHNYLIAIANRRNELLKGNLTDTSISDAEPDDNSNEEINQGPDPGDPYE